jgi:mRNA interferase YafQ
MRTVRYTSRFRRDYKREKSGRPSKRLDAELLEAVTVLAKDEPLPRRYFDHRSAANRRITATATSGLTGS